MAEAGVIRNIEPIRFRTLQKYPEYNTSNESESEPEATPESTKPKSKWIENDDDVYTENDPAYLVLYDYAKGKKPCMPYTDETGTTYYVYVLTSSPQKTYSTSIEEFRKRYLPIRKSIHDLTQYYTATTFPDAPDGIYTWIVGDKGKFLAGRVRSILEMGTLHKQLADVSKSKHIVVAGECSKVGKTAYFNIQSGTFSLAIIRRKNKSRLNEATKQQLLQAKGHAIFESMGLTPIAFGGTYSLINPRSTPITKEELQSYVAAGFDVLLYEKREDCKGDLFTKDYPRAIRFQEGGSRQTHEHELVEKDPSNNRMEGPPLALSPIGKGPMRNRANTVGNTSNIWEVNVNALVKNLKPGNANTIGRKAANISWANKPLKKSTLPPLPPSPNGNTAGKSRKSRKTRKARRTRKQRK